VSGRGPGPSTSSLGQVFVVEARPVIGGIVRAAATTGDAAVEITDGDLVTVLAGLDARPDAIVVVDLDASIERGLEILRTVGRSRPLARTVAISSRADGSLVLDSIRYGARAFVRAPDDLPRLPEVMAAVTHGQRFVPPGSEPLVAAELTAYVRRSRDGEALDQTITRRQREILALLADGFTIAQIGRKLSISSRTVETHVANIYRKLSVRSRLQAIRRAAALGIIELR
jgi:DNA-binding NarL/FixJ family response regulator